MSAVPGESGWAAGRPPSAWEATVPIGPLAGALPGVLGGKGTCLMAHGVSEGQGTYTRTHEPTLRYVHTPPPTHTHRSYLLWTDRAADIPAYGTAQDTDIFKSWGGAGQIRVLQTSEEVVFFPR